MRRQPSAARKLPESRHPREWPSKRSLPRCILSLVNQREQLVFEAARGLIRSKLRQHLYRKGQAVSVRRGEGECFDLVIDAEKSTEVACEASLISALKLWGEVKAGTPYHDVLCVVLRLALAKALERSHRFIVEKQAENEYEDVKAWVLEFVDAFRPEDLVHADR